MFTPKGGKVILTASRVQLKANFSYLNMSSKVNLSGKFSLPRKLKASSKSSVVDQSSQVSRTGEGNLLRLVTQSGKIRDSSSIGQSGMVSHFGMIGLSGDTFRSGKVESSFGSAKVSRAIYPTQIDNSSDSTDFPPLSSKSANGPNDSDVEEVLRIQIIDTGHGISKVGR